MLGDTRGLGGDIRAVGLSGAWQGDSLLSFMSALIYLKYGIGLLEIYLKWLQSIIHRKMSAALAERDASRMYVSTTI